MSSLKNRLGADHYEMLDEQWSELFDKALIPITVQHPGWLQPMLEELASETDKVTLVCGYDGAGDSPELISLAALERMSVRRGFLFPIATTWDSGFLFSGIPLLQADRPGEALVELLSVASREHQVNTVLLLKVPGEGPMYDTINRAVSEGKILAQYFDEHERAILLCDQSFDSWYASNFSRKRRKEFHRLRSRLSELGDVRVETWCEDEPLLPWIDGFLELELSGWKGRQGTAIACDPRQSEFLRKSLTALAESGQLLFWRICLDGEPIAMLFAFVGGRHAWLGKMAYREDLAKFSPGVMVILEASKWFLDVGTALSVDSAADPNHPMIDNIWRDRIKIADVLLSVQDEGGGAFRRAVQSERIRRKVRGYAKRIYNSMRRR